MDASHAIEEAVQGLTPGDSGMRIALLVGLGEGVPETPTIARGKFRMCGISPLGEHLGDLARRDGPAVSGADDDVVGLGIAQPQGAVGIDAVVKLDKLVAELAHCLILPGLCPSCSQLPVAWHSLSGLGIAG